MMELTKIFKRESGRQYQVTVNIIQPSLFTRAQMHWNVTVHYREKGKRKWWPILGSRSRHAYYDDYNPLISDDIYDHITKEEILAMKTEIWESNKPTLE